MDYKHEAESILYEHTSAIMSSAHIEFDTNEDMFNFTNEECGFILTKRLLEGKYTPMQYNAVRNELAEMLWSIFGPHIEAESAQKMVDEFVKLFSI